MYLPGHHRAFVPAPIQGPDNSFRTPDWFFQEVSRLMSTPVPVPKSPPFLFDMSDASCLHNQNVLASFGYDLKRVIDNNAPDPPFPLAPNFAQQTNCDHSSANTLFSTP